MRHVCFFAGYLRRFWLQLIISVPLERFIWAKDAVATVCGIKVINHSNRLKVDERFRTDTVAALHLIQSVDSRRFKRIQREIKHIVNWHLLSRGTYTWPIRTCYVDYNRFRDHDNEEWRLWCYASLLVHEATHGAIYSRHINYTPTLRSRIERLCHTESSRFVTKSNTRERQWSEALVPPFDENDWHDSWHLSFSQKLIRTMAHLREARRSRKSDGDTLI